MRSKYIFHNDNYYHTLRNQIGQGMPVFHGSRQRGGGLGSVFGVLAKYALPILKYIAPFASRAGASVLEDVALKRSSIKDSLKTHGKSFLKSIGSSLIKKQFGGGIKRKIRKKKTKGILKYNII